MDNITFGRYSPLNTFIHKIDPRNKVFLLILLISMVFFQFSIWSTNLIFSGLMLILTLILCFIAKIKLSQILKTFLSMWIMVLFLLIVYVFIPNSSYVHVAFYIGNYPIYWDSFYQCGYIVLRIMMMLTITMILTSTTKPLDLTYAFEWYMTPLKIIRFPAHEIAMTISIALRFIPTLLEEADRIMKAQSSRGVDFVSGGLIKKFNAIISLIVPLLISSFQRSDELANAMEAKGYDPRGKRTKYRKLKFTYRDIIAFVIILLLFSGLLTLLIYNYNVSEINLIKFFFNVEPIF
jgi:energy-coupling factor transport system permease protein